MTASDHALRYDDVPYPALVHPATHPRVIGAMATLFGLDAAPPDRCRVLDLGCASGTNVMSLAADAPESRFVGVDVAASGILRGRERARLAGIDNVRLEVGDLSADLDLGEFDYIIAHGVYSWVSPALQDRLLATIARHLAPGGLAYVSYNTYPGWHLVDLVRQLFLRQTDPEAPPLERVRQARAVLDAHIAGAAEGSMQRAILIHEQQMLATASDPYIFHEHFVAEHHPTYFEDFVAHADAAGLTYVADARPNHVLPGTQPPNVAAAVAGLKDRVAVQQALDHHLNTRFRWSILCPKGAARPDLTVAPEALARLHVSLPRNRELTLLEDGAEVHNAMGRRVTVRDRVVASFLEHLYERSPSSVPLVDLVDLSDPGGRVLGGALVGLFFSGVLSLTTGPIAAASTLPERPRVPLLNRVQAQLGEAATNRLFESQLLDDVGHRLFPLLDGTRDVAALAAEIGEPADLVEGLLRVYVDVALILP
ncbi:MAG: methyltransferase domain-containing protein [Deltaproteobacteria bacterium]|nr:MAG: methyltransferase domain-containing protein [Deltaproteobacteria bacterium]